MLKERNEGSCHGCHLVRCDIHIVNLLFGNYREVGLKTALDAVVKNVAILVHLDIGK